jgi:nucleoside-triphosphatase THEP1
MKVAYTLSPDRGAINLLLAELAEDLASRGLRLCGTVQIDTERDQEHHCDMDVKVLPAGPTIRISQTLGKEARSCRLDPQALEQAVVLTERELEGDADLLIVNKFGKHEADGRGFRDTIGLALGKGIPVIVGASRLNVDALNTYCDGMAVELAPDVQALREWILQERADAA